MCDRVAVLYLGRIVEHGTTAEVFATRGTPTPGPCSPARRSLDRRRPRRSARRRPPRPRARRRRQAIGGCPLRPRCPFAADVCAEEPPLAARRARRAGWSPAGAPTRSPPAPPCPRRTPTATTTDHREDDEMTDAPLPALRRHRRHVRRRDGARPATQQIRFQQGVDDAGEPWRGVLDAIDALGTDLAAGRAVHPRHDARPQRRARAARRRHRDHHQRGDARHLPDRARQHPGEPHVRLHLRAPAVARRAAPHRRRARPPRPPRPGDRAARRGRRARRRRPPRRARRALDRRLLPALVPRPDARAARRGDRPRGRTRTSRCRRRRASSASTASTSARPPPCSTPTSGRSSSATSPTSSASWRTAASPGAS